MPVIEMCGELPTLTGYSNYQAYNVLDSMITAQLAPRILEQMNPNHLKTYRREIRVRNLCLEMSTKGFTIDQMCLAELDYTLEKDEQKALSILHQFCDAVDARHVNPRSTTDIPWLFYEHLSLPITYEYDRKTKERKISTGIKTLEKLRDLYPIATPFVGAILAYREVAKMRSVFKRGLEPGTGNLRCNFSPTGTDTGRLSSQQNVYQRGTNAQNLTDRMRQVITAPDGYAILNFDLKTAESLAVGFISRCRAYIAACLTGDVHTAVARLNWSELPWPDDIKLAKALAEQPYYRHFTRRDLAKKGGHATNYYGQPATVQKVAFESQVPISVVEEFQDKYLGNDDKGIPGAFPEIRSWHLETIARVQMDGVLINALGRERRFWGRADEGATHRAAIAFNPQSLVADVMNEGLCAAQAWLVKEFRGNAKAFIGRRGNLLPLRADLRAQIHDAGVFLVPLEGLDEIVPVLLEKLVFPVDFGDLGVMTIPFDVSVGKRWNKAPKAGGTAYTRQGLRDWKPGQGLHW